MRRTTLGRSGLEVSRICFGTWQFGGGWGGIDEDAAHAAVAAALELGVDFFDTAQAYGWGRSEQLLSDAVRAAVGDRRDDVVIATKGGLRRTDGGLVRDSSPEWLRRGVEDSLDRLGRDRIDLYQVHWPDPDTPLQDTAEALEQLVEEGLIAHVGVSNFDVDQMRAFAEVRPVETLQPPYHLLRRGIEDEILPYCREHDIGVLVYSPLAHGLLTGRYEPDHRFERGDWRRHSDVFAGEAFARNLEVVERLRDFAEHEVGCAVVQLAIAWTLHQPGVDAAIVGAREAAHAKGAAMAAEVTLTDEQMAAIDAIVADAEPVDGPTPEGA